MESILNLRVAMTKALLKEGFFAETFTVHSMDTKKLQIEVLSEGVGEFSDSFSFGFENTSIMKDGVIYAVKTTPEYNGKRITLGDIMETGDVEEQYFIPEEKLYYTNPEVSYSDETLERLPKEKRQTWQYIKGAKNFREKLVMDMNIFFSEGPIAMIDAYGKPARTMLTSEGKFSRTTYIVKDKRNGRIRLLTAAEAERIQGFPTNHTKYCLVNGETVEMPLNKRKFMMGNALVVNLVTDMEKTLEKVFDAE